MSIDHTTPAYTDEARPYIEALGGKAGGLQYLESKVPELRQQILPMVVVEPGQTWNHKLPKRKRTQPRCIVRTSHRNDFQGLVDVLPTQVTEQDTASKKKLEAEITALRSWK